MRYIRTTLTTFVLFQFVVVANLFGQANEWGTTGINTWTWDKVSIGGNTDFAIRDIHIYRDPANVGDGAPTTDATPGIRFEVEGLLSANNIWDVYAEQSHGFVISDEGENGLTGLRLWNGNSHEQGAAQRAGLWTSQSRTNFQIGEYRPITFSSTGGNNDGIFGAYMGFNAYLGQPDEAAATVTKMEGNLGGSVLVTDYTGNVEIQTFNEGVSTEVQDIVYDPQFNFTNQGVLEFKSWSEAWTDSHWNVRFKSPAASAWVSATPNDNGDYMGIGMTNSGWYFIRSKNAPGETADIDGTCGKYPFYVTDDGKTVTREVEVTRTGWCDYVFDDNYELAELEEVESFIKTNKHLPGVPNEEEIVNNGLRLGEMSAIHMKKIEELTLYVIELQKSVETLQRENAAVNAKLQALEK